MRFGLGTALAFLLLATGAPVRFEEAASKAGISFTHVSGSPAKDYILETIGSGVAWLDYNHDGWMDLYLVNGGRWEQLQKGVRTASNALFENRRDGTFVEVTQAAGLAGTQWGMGAVAVDYDNDGWSDLFVANYGPNSLFRNRRDGSFEDVSAESGLDSPLWGSSAAFADYDGDGWLDVYVANYVMFDHRQAPPPKCQYRGITVHCGPKGLVAAPDRLYRNNRDGTFADVTETAGVQVNPAYGLGVVWVDFDQDGDPDIFVANDSTANFLFENQGDGRFQEIGLISGFAYSQDGNAQAGMGIAVGDYDRDGQLDLYLTHFSDDYNTLYRNQGDSMFRDRSYAAKLAFGSWQYLAWGTFFFDYDNDGWLDLFVANGHIYPQVDDYQIGTSFLQRNQLFRNLGEGKFEEATEQAGPAFRERWSSRAAAYADYDNDGDLDIAINNLDQPASLWMNQGGSRSGHWFSLSLEGTQSNRAAIGARVEVVSQAIRQLQELQAGSSYQSSHDPRLHFGIGSAEKVDLVVRWPSGKVQKFKELGADRFYYLKEGSEPRETTTSPMNSGASP